MFICAVTTSTVHHHKKNCFRRNGAVANETEITLTDLKHEAMTKLHFFSAYPGQLVLPEVRPARIADRLRGRSSQSERRPRPLLRTLHQIQTFAVCKLKKTMHRI